MRIISFIEDEEVIKKILKHPGFSEICTRLPTMVNAISKFELTIDDSQRAVGLYGTEINYQLPNSEKLEYFDPEYPKVYLYQ